MTAFLSDFSGFVRPWYSTSLTEKRWRNDRCYCTSCFQIFEGRHLLGNMDGSAACPHCFSTELVMLRIPMTLGRG